MATLFIALQCCQCSTMQVKQQRKSGNKWVCAVCNQRQSVRRIHARGHVARELRKFVQDFNMARAGKASDGSDPVFSRSDGSRDLSVAGEDSGAASCGSPLIFTKKKRTDWSEYLDSEIDDGEDSKEQDNIGLEGEGKATTSVMQPSTKWSEYLDEVDAMDDILFPAPPGAKGGLPDCYASSQVGVAVEEEVHPDFM
ncbi:hypothetical protein Cni_G19605 [Canna indica]|uniref:MRN complex-interacting protein N-terminal domain-containing protein n=1 Tax=Canna indica TaxID=4628 RepID=A0AAQ3QIP2_9LILI|nr:hypothetical protein Cni_G19605 [Canna indica]